MGEIAVRQALLHGVVAAAFVEALLAVWNVRRPGTRLAFWSLALAFPFIVAPALVALAPFRAQDHFAAGRALFSSSRWADVRITGLPADTLGFALLFIAGIALFLRDAVPFAREAWAGSHDEPPHVAPPSDLLERVATRAAGLGTRTPAVQCVDSEASILFVRGIGARNLVVSTGLLRELSGEQLDAAIVHELAHVRFHDPLVGWLLVGARLIMFWNPAVQLVARAIVQEMERRADALSVAASGAEVLAGALRKLAPSSTADSAPDGRRQPRVRTFIERMNREHQAARSSALGDGARPTRFVPARLAVTALALGGIVFFVV